MIALITGELTLNIHWKDWCGSWSFNTLVTWGEELTHWKRPWCWERLKTGGEGATEDEMVGWHHWLNGHESEQTLTTNLDSILKSRDIALITPVNPKRNQPWIFIGRTNAEADAPILWPPEGKSWLIGKDPDAGKDWRQQEKGLTEDEMVGWHLRLNGHKSEQTLGDGGGQRKLVCCSSWGHKELDTT